MSIHEILHKTCCLEDESPLLFEFGNVSGGCFRWLELKEEPSGYMCGVTQSWCLVH